MRKFEIISEKEWKKSISTNCEECINIGFKKPFRSTKNSAGYDFISPININIEPHSMTLIPTGIKASMESDEVLQIFPRSSIGFKTSIRLANTVGIIDSDYYNNIDNEGHIFIKFYNSTDKDYVVNIGDKIAQGIFIKYLTVDDENSNFIKREGGLGSTGKRFIK